MPACARPGVRVPRQTHDCDAAVLVRRHLAGFLERLEESGHGPLPEFVKAEPTRSPKRSRRLCAAAVRDQRPDPACAPTNAPPPPPPARARHLRADQRLGRRASDSSR